MSNRLTLALTAPRREPHEWMPAPGPAHGLAASAIAWLRDVAAADVGEMPAAMRRDLGLPDSTAAGVVFACEVERSRLRL
jgi:hypothetical protein